MRISICCLLALALLGAMADKTLAQQRRPSYPKARPKQPAADPAFAPQVAARPQRPPTGKPGDIVEQQVLSTIMSQVVLGGLDNPSGIAIQPKSNEVFVAETGAGRIGRLNDVAGQYALVPVLAGFEQLDTSYEVGPQALAFIDKYTLAVGTNLPKPIRLYRVSAVGTGDAAQIRGELALGADQFDPKRHGLLGLAATGGTLIAAWHADNQPGTVVKGRIGGDEPTQLVEFLRASSTLRGAAAIAIEPSGEIVIGQVGKTEVANDSALAIFDGSSGELLTTVGTGLHDIVGLAIGPQSGRLYAIDFASIAPEEGGLYRLDLKKDEGELVCRATRLMPLDRPTAMAFTPDGTLFITSLGSLNKEHEGGLLVRVYNDSKL